MNKQQIVEAMHKHISQRSGISFADYGDRAAFMQDYRKILKHGHNARTLLGYIARHDSITVEAIVKELKSSGRLVLTDKGTLDYCTGQCFWMEYRGAACSRLASIIWTWFREDCGYDTADKIRKQARREFGRGIAARWFN